VIVRQMDERLKALHVPLEGRLVVLEPLADRHEAELARAAQDGEVWTWIAMGGGPADESLRRWFEWARPPEVLAFATVRRSDGCAIGGTSYLEIHPEHARLEIGGTWLPAGAWGTGANVEAKLLLLQHAFGLGYQRVEFKTDARNVRARRALEALPAEFEGVFRKHMLVRGGERRDSAYYSVIDDEWPRVRENLRRRLARPAGLGEAGEPRAAT
jgi:RimJ/RimL family protein N-acetyltransferase